MVKREGGNMDSSRLTLALLAVLIVIPFSVGADSFVLAGPGGLVNKAITEVYVKAFREQTGHDVVVADWTQTAGELRAQVQSGKHAWDLAQVGLDTLELACKEGLVERIDWTRVVRKEELLEGAVTECGVGIQNTAVIVGYNGKLISNPPASLSEFFDVSRWPARTIGLRNDPRETLEFALLADGAKASEVYPLLATKAGVDRAFAKLDTIRPQIKWWKTGAEQVTRIVSGDVAISSGWNGRIQGVKQPNVDLRVAWRAGGLSQWGSWALVKGTPKKSVAYEFMRFVMSRPDLQAQYPNYINYGPPLLSAYKLMPKEMVQQLPTSEENRRALLPVDAKFWSEHVDELNERFAAWISR